MKQKTVSKSAAAESDTPTTLMLKKLQKVDFDALCLWLSESNSGYAWIVFDFSKLPESAQKSPVNLTASHRDAFFSELNKRLRLLDRPLMAVSYDSTTDISGYKDSGTECFVGFAPTKHLFRLKPGTIVKKAPKPAPKPANVWPTGPEKVAKILKEYSEVKNQWDKNPKGNLKKLLVAYKSLSTKEMTPEHAYKSSTGESLDSLPFLQQKKIKVFFRSLYKNDNT